MVEPFANSGDPDQTPRSAASDLGLGLPVTRLGVFSLQSDNHDTQPSQGIKVTNKDETCLWHVFSM